jgi:hypothetical protein
VNEDVTRAGVIAMFHERRVLPLMRWARRLNEMVPNVPLEGTVFVMGSLIMRRSRSTSSQCSRVFLSTLPSISTSQCVLMTASLRW